MGRKPTGPAALSHAERQANYRRRQEEERRKQLEAKGLPALPVVASMPGTRRWRALAEQAAVLLEQLHGEMETYWDDRSESWQDSERGQALREVVDGLPELVDQVRGLEL